MEAKPATRQSSRTHRFCFLEHPLYLAVLSLLPSHTSFDRSAQETRLIGKTLDGAQLVPFCRLVSFVLFGKLRTHVSGLIEFFLSPFTSAEDRRVPHFGAEGGIFCIPGSQRAILGSGLVKSAIFCILGSRREIWEMSLFGWREGVARLEKERRMSLFRRWKRRLIEKQSYLR